METLTLPLVQEQPVQTKEIKIKEVVLVAPGNPRIQFGAIINLPLALLCLAGWLRRDERFKDKIRILDMNIQKITEADFKDVALIGLTAITGHDIEFALQAARMAKTVNPKVIVVWGGIHASLMPEQTIAHELVDVVAIGEGEETFRELVESVMEEKDLAGIPGTWVKKDGNIVKGPARPIVDMNTLPLPAYDLVNVGHYHNIQRQFNYQSSRGCPYRCAFCYNVVFTARKWRSKSAPKIIQELRYLHETYGVMNYIMDDDEFLINIKRAQEVFQGIIDNHLNFTMTISCRLDMVQRIPEEMLHTMKKAGVKQIFFGAESGSETILKDILKDLKTEDILKGANRVCKIGIRPVLSFMSGFPTETFDDFKQTLEIIEKLWQGHPLITVNGIFPFNPYPGTELYHAAIKAGFKAPKTLEEWGKWEFQYDPDHPWLDKKKRRWMQIAFYIVRFKYYLKRLEDRYDNDLKVRMLKVLVSPLLLSAKIRWNQKWFAAAWEWDLFAFIVRKTFRYL